MGWENERALVTGAGGFIGSHLVEELVQRGARVTALVHYNARSARGNLDFLPAGMRNQIEVVFGDVRDPFSVNRVVRSQSVVFHLAALIGIPYSYHAPHSYVETNIHGTLNVLQAAIEHGARVVQTSTSEVYGSALYVPIDEQHPLQPQSPYSASKIGSDSLAISYHRSFELPVTIVRPFNAFGPRQSARAIIPTILSQLARRAPRLRLGSLTPSRDFTYVADLARAFVAAAECEAAVGQVTNFGTGRGVTIGELVEKCCAIADHFPEIEVEESRIRPEASEVTRLLCNNTRAVDLTGWRPQVSFDDGLRRVFEFITDHPPLFAGDHYAI